MTLADAGFAFFLNVSDFAVGRHLAIPADYAAAAERGEAEKPNETHRVLRLNRRAIYVPRPTFAASRLRRGRRSWPLLHATTWQARFGLRSTHIGAGKRRVHAAD